MKLDKLLENKTNLEDQIEYLYEQIEYLQDLSKVIKSSILQENSVFLLDFLNFENYTITKQLVSKLNLKIEDFKIIKNVERLNSLVNFQIKQQKIELKRLKAELNKIIKKIK